MKVNKLFNYNIKISNYNLPNNTYWSIVEEFHHIPISFVSSDKHHILILVHENNKTLIDTWYLFKASEDIIRDYIHNKITYKDFINKSDIIYEIEWNLNNDNIIMKSIISKEKAKEKFKPILNLYPLCDNKDLQEYLATNLPDNR